MSSFFGRFKGNANPSSPIAASTPAAKKDPNALPPTPLEKLLVDAGPLRNDGSDKFFGFENYGSTCYANSIIQCLYYTVDFRDEVLKYPTASPFEISNETLPPLPSIHTDDEINESLVVRRPRRTLPSPKPTSPRKPPPPPGTPGTPGHKPEDNKDSAEYRKKLALAAGPVLEMNYENSSSYGMNESLFTALKDIFEAVLAHRSRIGVVSPHKFLEILRRENEMFRSVAHQDAHEFLNLLLNQVVEGVEKHRKQDDSSQSLQGPSLGTQPIAPATPIAALNSADTVKSSPDNPRWVHDLFEGTLTSETRCLTCENTSQRDEAFLDLSVDIEQHSSVTACLKKFSEEEMLCERNKFHCDNCGGLQEAEKRMKIKKPPRILALHLKRFKYTEDMQRLQKLFHRVVYPYHLRLFNTTDDADDPDRMYELYAVVVHIGGGPYHGHYVSIVKTQDRGWLLFDDELVEPVDKSYVQNFFGGEHKLACAYVLFYRETTFEAVQREQEAEDFPAAAQQTVASPNGTIPEEKTNDSLPNGWHVAPGQAATADETEEFLTLQHASTAPLKLQQSPDQPMLHTVFTSPVLPDSGLKSPSSQPKMERKAGDKEADERERRRSGATGDILPGRDMRQAEIIDNMVKSGGLNRFKHTSVSLKQKPRFWSLKDKSDARHTADLTRHSADVPGPAKSNDAGSSSANPGKPQRSKSNRFSLGWKKP